MVLRFGPAMDSVIDSTQTAFVPGRDIADNVLLHLEEIDYVQETAGAAGLHPVPGLREGLRPPGQGLADAVHGGHAVPSSSMRWVRLLLEGTCGQVVYNGGFTAGCLTSRQGALKAAPSARCCTS